VRAAVDVLRNAGALGHRVADQPYEPPPVTTTLRLKYILYC
jgi:hypothetical protein